MKITVSYHCVVYLAPHFSSRTWIRMLKNCILVRHNSASFAITLKCGLSTCHLVQVQIFRDLGQVIKISQGIKNVILARNE